MSYQCSIVSKRLRIHPERITCPVSVEVELACEDMSCQCQHSAQHVESKVEDERRQGIALLCAPGEWYGSSEFPIHSASSVEGAIVHRSYEIHIRQVVLLQDANAGLHIITVEGITKVQECQYNTFFLQFSCPYQVQDGLYLSACISQPTKAFLCQV